MTLDVDVAMHHGSHTSHVSLVCPIGALGVGLTGELNYRFAAGGIWAVYRILDPFSWGAYRVLVVLNQHHRCRTRIRKPTQPLLDIWSKTKPVELVRCRREPMEQWILLVVIRDVWGSWASPGFLCPVLYFPFRRGIDCTQIRQCNVRWINDEFSTSEYESVQLYNEAREMWRWSYSNTHLYAEQLNDTTLPTVTFTAG
jgi:hypothetical protein